MPIVMRPWPLVVLSCLCGCREPVTPSRALPAHTPAAQVAPTPTSSPTHAPSAEDLAAKLWRDVEPVEPTRANPYLDDVRLHRATWEARGERDYVFVVDMPAGLRAAAAVKQRIVVRDGRVQSTEGLEYGGSIGAEHAPTMASVFDRVEAAAGFGAGGVPERFEVQYDPRHDTVRSLDADARSIVADDEATLRVYCYSTDPAGCRARDLTRAECAVAHGSVLPSDQPANSCSPLGRVAGGGFCCQPFHRATPRLSDAACHRTGGQVKPSCDAAEVGLGFATRPEHVCCRAFLEE